MIFVAILVFIIGFIMGNFFTLWRMLKMFKHDPNFVIGFLDKWTSLDEHHEHDTMEELCIYIEEEDGKYYAYNSENSRFITSGHDLEQCIRSVMDIHPTMKITCTE